MGNFQFSKEEEENVNIDSSTQGKSTVCFNNKCYNGKTIKIENNIIYVDGKKVEDNNDNKKKIVYYPVKINVIGGAHNISTLSGDINVQGNVNEIKTTSGDVQIKGKINNNVCTVSGDVKASSIGGNISTVSGDIFQY